MNENENMNSLLDESLTQPPSQEYNLTNSTNESLERSRTLSLGGQNDGDVPDEEEDCWGLLRRKGVDQECRLLHRVKDDHRDLYTVGRKETCDIVVSNSQVSAVHCMIYCAYSEDDMLTMYVEDCSKYGTYVNSSLMRLKHGERSVLKSGYEIYLMNPRHVKGEQLVSFVFINMRERLFAIKKIDGAPVTSSNSPSYKPTSAAHNEGNRQQSCHSSSSLSIRRNSTLGSRIEDLYVIGDRIGAGMCGSVHICAHKATRTKWAVKIIDTKKFGISPGTGLSVGELRQEAELMKVLNHPNIIRIRDTFETTSKIFIVMELVSGGDLFDRIIDQGKYPESRARAVMRMLLEAVKYLHDNNIIHRDLKPENILLVDESYNSQVKLTDFGLAKKASHEGLKTFCGTPQYFAPEVLERKEVGNVPNSKTQNNRYGFKADMWSLGVVLYIMLSGSFPFDEENLYDQLRDANYSVNGPEWRDISSHAKHFVRSLMTLNPADRLDVTQAMEHPWMKTVPAANRRHTVGGQKASKSNQNDANKISQEDCKTRQAPRKNFPEQKSPEETVQRTKTFTPVFWSNRPAFSATFVGEVSSQVETADQAKPVTSDAPAAKIEVNSSSVQSSSAPSMTRPPRKASAVGQEVDDIADFSSTDDESQQKRNGAENLSAKKSVEKSKNGKKRKRMKSLVTCPVDSKKSKPLIISSGANNSLLDQVRAGSGISGLHKNDGQHQSSKFLQRHNSSMLQSNVKDDESDQRLESKDGLNITSNNLVDLTKFSTPSDRKKKKSKIVTSKKEKESLRMPVKTIEHMFKLSQAKQDRQRRNNEEGAVN